ncbi:MAG: glycosyltransferase [Pseudomonadota bacterium]
MEPDAATTIAQTGELRERARSAYNAKDYASAERHLRMLCERSPDDPWPREILVRLYLNTGRREAACRSVEALAGQASSAHLLRRLLQTLVRFELWPSLTLIAESQDFAQQSDDIVAIAIEGHPDIAWCESLLESLGGATDRPRLDQLLSIRRRYGAQGHAIEAAQALRTFLGNGDDSTGSGLAHRLFSEVDDLDLLASLWERLLSAARPCRRSISLGERLLARLYHAQAWRAAANLGDALASVSPLDEVLSTKLARCGYMAERPETTITACEHLAAAGSCNPQEAEWVLTVGIRQRRPDLVGRAVEILGPGHPVACDTCRRALILALEEHDAELVQLILDVPLGDVAQAEFASLVHDHRGQPDRADAVLMEALLRYATDATLLLRRAESRWQAGDVAGALQTCDRLLAAHPEHEVGHRLRFSIGYKIWPVSRCVSEADAVAHRFPDIPYLRLNQAAARLDASKDASGALAVMDKALERWPDDVRLLKVRAMALSRLGLHTDARRVIETTMDLAPSNPEIAIAAAEIEHAAGSSQGQLRYVNRALEAADLTPLQGIRFMFGRATPVSDAPEFADPRLVSVVMSHFGDTALLERSVTSILAQTHQQLELIIVDDGSKVEDVAAIRALAKSDGRVRVIELPTNQGTYVARNIGLESARGEFVTFMDSDDWCHPQRLERQIQRLDQDSQASAVIHQAVRIRDDNSFESYAKSSLKWAYPSLFFRRGVLDTLGYFDRVSVGADSEFAARITAALGPRALFRDPLPTSFMRRASRSLTGGGPFKIGWRSIAGDRLAYHATSRNWHRQIKAGTATPFLSATPAQRPFAAPDRMQRGAMVL